MYGVCADWAQNSNMPFDATRRMPLAARKRAAKLSTQLKNGRSEVVAKAWRRPARCRPGLGTADLVLTAALVGFVEQYNIEFQFRAKAGWACRGRGARAGRGMQGGQAPGARAAARGLWHELARCTCPLLVYQNSSISMVATDQRFWLESMRNPLCQIGSGWAKC